MKIGILTFHWATNHGAILQVYALQKTLESMFDDCEVKIIDYWPKKYEKTVRRALRSKSIRQIKRSIFDLRKERKLKPFRDSLPLTKHYDSQKQLEEELTGFDVIITGSDQVWNQSFTRNGENGKTGTYYLPFALSATRLSYAASFGTTMLDEDTASYIRPMLQKLDAISVRESSGKQIIDKMGLESTIVCDPSALLSQSEYKSIAESIDKTDYVAVYSLRMNTGKQMREVQKCFSDKDVINIEMLPLQKWIGAIADASFLVTDSFHGMMVALKTHTPFSVVLTTGNLSGMNDRFFTVLNELSLTDRILSENNTMDDTKRKKIDWDFVDKRLNDSAGESVAFLQKHCQPKEIKHINIDQKDKCCGCSACEQVCSKKSITLTEDREGFCYPVLNWETCINCGSCISVCPVINSPHPDRKESIAAYVGRAKEETLVRESSSGGVFSLFARQTLLKGGVVFSTSFSEDYSVLRYQVAETVEALSAFRGSKYLQALKNDVFLQIKTYLDQGVPVLFCGAPCETEGLYRFLSHFGTPTDHLLLIDFICHGVPSPKVWRQYKQIIERRKKSKINSVAFRNKEHGWRDYYFAATFENGAEIKEPMANNTYLQGFLHELYLRPSCYHCAFKGTNRISDLTIGDAWGIWEFAPQYYDESGVSLLLCHSEKGMQSVESIKENAILNLLENISDIVRYNRALVESSKLNKMRASFFEKIDHINEKDIWKASDAPFKLRVKQAIKKVVKQWDPRKKH